jgi:hypothetical protein
MTDEPKRVIVLGTVSLPEEGETVAFNFPADLDPEAISAELERVEAKRAADALAETRRLHQMFLPDDTKPVADPPAPLERDWLRP